MKQSTEMVKKYRIPGIQNHIGTYIVANVMNKVNWISFVFHPMRKKVNISEELYITYVKLCYISCL